MCCYCLLWIRLPPTDRSSELAPPPQKKNSKNDFRSICKQYTQYFTSEELTDLIVIFSSVGPWSLRAIEFTLMSVSASAFIPVFRCCV